MNAKFLSSLVAVFALTASSACGDPCVDDGFGTKKCNADDSSSGSSASGTSADETGSESNGESGDESGTGTTGTGTTDTGTTGSGTTDSGTTDTATTDSGTTDTMTTTGNTTGTGMCSGTETFEMDASEATLMGWGSQPSGLDQGEQIFPTSPDGEANFELDVPCEDTWHIWVLGWDQGLDDSFIVQVDGMPNQGSIFDIDCSDLPPGEGQYRWAHLNARGGGGTCDVDNWWEVDLDGGSHDLTFFPRESSAISRIVVTNDASYTPS